MRTEVFTGQVITCGGWSLALSMQWTNLIVDSFELIPIPRAPNWLVGAANIDGNIVPVVDLSVYFVPNAAPMMIDRHNRLLLGGKLEGVEFSSVNDSAFAILFTGLPMQIQYSREAIDPMVIIPERMRELCIGMAKNNAADGFKKLHFEMNTDRFIDYLSSSLIE